ncbi:MAG TPA: response regulator [Verrucomicrobiae bacterium]|jgi:two-component system alkaline phosphatase synthesis response regulator PhoP|nr:response regulator [Verrucomicrobiae bacterium]
MKPRVLVVDDESDFIQLLKYNLENQGFDILTAGDGVQALNVARRELPDVVLIDLMLPDIDGFSVCEILRSQPSTSKVPIIVVSALDGEYVQSRGIQAGVACCFKKPVDMKVLGESIRSNYEMRLETIRSELAEDDRRKK